VDSGFSHRFRPDGNIEFICHRCFLMGGPVTHEVDLDPLERRHACNPEDSLRSGWLAEESKLLR